MTSAIRLYQYLAPALLAPLSLYLWWNEYRNWPQSLVAWLIPILWAYIVPAVGTNLCKVWEFSVRWRLGRFRPHHGFVFGSATATIVWLIHGQQAKSIIDILRFAVILCSVLGFWNLIYEILALRAGVLRVYNQPWADGCGEEAIAFDYAPWFFGGFGAAYGLAIGILEYLVKQRGLPNALESWGYILSGLILSIVIPVLGFVLYSLRTHGHSGTRPVNKG